MVALIVWVAPEFWVDCMLRPDKVIVCKAPLLDKDIRAVVPSAMIIANAE